MWTILNLLCLFLALYFFVFLARRVRADADARVKFETAGVTAQRDQLAAQLAEIERLRAEAEAARLHAEANAHVLVDAQNIRSAPDPVMHGIWKPHAGGRPPIWVCQFCGRSVGFGHDMCGPCSDVP